MLAGWIDRGKSVGGLYIAFMTMPATSEVITLLVTL